jgi:excisionase family DNA binding protein
VPRIRAVFGLLDSCSVLAKNDAALDSLPFLRYKGVVRYTTKQAADKLGVHRVTLQNKIAKGSVPAPKMESIGGGSVRLWTSRDIEKARKVLAGVKLGRKRKK